MDPFEPDGARFWIVTEHGLRSDYVRNLLAGPIDGEWRTRVAHVVPEDPQARLDRIADINPPARANINIVRRSATTSGHPSHGRLSHGARRSEGVENGRLGPGRILPADAR